MFLTVATMIVGLLPTVAYSTVYTFSDIPIDRDLRSLSQAEAFQWELLYPNTKGNASHYNVTAATLTIYGVWNATGGVGSTDVLYLDILNGTHAASWTLITDPSPPAGFRTGSNSAWYTTDGPPPADLFDSTGWTTVNLLDWTTWPSEPSQLDLTIASGLTWLSDLESSLNAYGGVTFGFDPDIDPGYFESRRIQFDITIETEEGFELPEPGTYALLALALGVPFYFRRRKS